MTLDRETATLRKKKMMELDKQRAAQEPLSDLRRTDYVKRDGILAKAQEQLDEQLDEVKTMNRMVLYSKVVTVRDKQLEENKRLEKEFVSEHKKLDLMMEIERLKSLKLEEDREVRKAEQRRFGAL
jgi:hypothetical protein